MFQQYPRFHGLAFVFLATTISACGGGSVSPLPGKSDTTTFANSGAGVKGPMAGATVRFYGIDAAQPLLYNAAQPVGFSTTDSDGTFKQITLNRGASAPFVVVVDGRSAIDIHTGRTPVIPELVTVVTAADFAARRPIYATPLTTLTILTAREAITRSGASRDAVMTAIDNAALAVRDNFGFGLLDGIDVLRDPPLLNNATTTPEAQRALTLHRAAVEAVSAVIYSMAQTGVSNHALTRETTVQTIMAILARDVASDGVADGRNGATVSTEVDTSLFTSAPATLMVPDTNIRIADIADVIAAEATLQQVDVEVFTDSLVVTVTPIAPAIPLESIVSTTTSTSTTSSTSSSTTLNEPTTTTRFSTTTTSTAPSTTTTSLVSSHPAGAYYVDRNHALANDANAGTAAMPFKTISRAAQVARAGDTVVVMSGTYPESVEIANSGMVGQPITFTASGTVVVSPPAPDSWSGVFTVLGKSDITIAGFTAENGYFGFKVDEDRGGTPSTRITLKNNHARLTKSSGINVNASRDIVVDANVVEKTNMGGVHEMISIIGTDGFVVSNNDVFNGAFVINGVAKEGKEGIDAKFGSSNGRIVNNRVHDLERLGIYADAWSALTQNIEIVGNVVYNCKDGIALASEEGGLLRNVLVANNITYNNRNSGIVVAPWAADGPRENIRIVNNTAYGNDAGGINIATSKIYRIEIQNNIVADNNGPALRADNAGLISTASNNLASGKNVGNILHGTLVGDPRFVSATSGNFQLDAGSAAINSGIALDHVPADITGRLRPLGGAYDIGAFESQ